MAKDVFDTYLSEINEAYLRGCGLMALDEMVAGRMGGGLLEADRPDI